MTKVKNREVGNGPLKHIIIVTCTNHSGENLTIELVPSKP